MGVDVVSLVSCMELDYHLRGFEALNKRHVTQDVVWSVSQPLQQVVLQLYQLNFVLLIIYERISDD